MNEYKAQQAMNAPLTQNMLFTDQAIV